MDIHSEELTVNRLFLLEEMKTAGVGRVSLPEYWEDSCFHHSNILSWLTYPSLFVFISWPSCGRCHWARAVTALGCREGDGHWLSSTKLLEECSQPRSSAAEAIPPLHDGPGEGVWWIQTGRSLRWNRQGARGDHHPQHVLLVEEAMESNCGNRLSSHLHSGDAVPLLQLDKLPPYHFLGGGPGYWWMRWASSSCGWSLTIITISVGVPSTAVVARGLDYIPEWFFVFLLISTQVWQEELTSEEVWCGRVQ